MAETTSVQDFISLQRRTCTRYAARYGFSGLAALAALLLFLYHLPSIIDTVKVFIAAHFPASAPVVEVAPEPSKPWISDETKAMIQAFFFKIGDGFVAYNDWIRWLSAQIGRLDPLGGTLVRDDDGNSHTWHGVQNMMYVAGYFVPIVSVIVFTAIDGARLRATKRFIVGSTLVLFVFGLVSSAGVWWLNSLADAMGSHSRPNSPIGTAIGIVGAWIVLTGVQTLLASDKAERYESETKIKVLEPLPRAMIRFGLIMLGTIVFTCGGALVGAKLSASVYVAILMGAGTLVLYALAVANIVTCGLRPTETKRIYSA